VISHVSVDLKINVLEISVAIIRVDVTSTLMVVMEEIPETLVFNS
jgi:hypothetical protein